MKNNQPITIKSDITKLPNKMHFDIQRSTKSAIFIDKKKRARNGYTKYKNKDYE